MSLLTRYLPSSSSTLRTLVTLSSALAFPAASPAGSPTSGSLPEPAISLAGPTTASPSESALRPLSPDRPDATESPITLDAGHAAVEVSLFDWRHDHDHDTYTVLSTNLKLGLTANTDLQLVFDSYAWEDSPGDADAEGFGDVQVRWKVNLWGNDGGPTALALFPFVKIPTGAALSNDEWEGGLIIPFALDLSEGLGLGLMAEIDVVYDDEEAQHQFEFLHSAVLGVDLSERWGAFVEYIGIAGENPYQAAAATGLTFSVNEDLILDAGLQFGLNDAAEELGLFTGFTKRF